MKKKVLFLVMSLCIMMLVWGCSKNGATNETEDTTTVTPTVAPTAAADATGTDETGTDATGTDATTEVAPVKEAYEVSEFITLGEYKGLEITYTKLEVTDENVDAAIQEELSANATDQEVTDRAVENGDTVNIDYEGLKDGVAFEGGTAAASDLVIGSGSFVPGFEEGLIGAKVGDKLALDITFPADYTSAELAGQAVVFNVTVNSIKVSVVPELTEDYVKTNTDYTTIDEYKEAKRAELLTANETTMKNEKINNLLTAIIGNATISSYPQTLLDYYSYEMKSYYQQYASMFGYELADFLYANGMTEESFATESNSYAQERAGQELALNAIIKAENMQLSDEEYKAGVAKYIADYGYASEEEFFQNATEEQIRESLIWEKAVDFIVEKAVIV